MNLTFRAGRADASVLKRGLSWGHLLNIYKLKATSCGLFASGNRVRSPMSGMGCSFRLRPRWETPSHSDRKFRVAFSARALNWKLHPTPKANSWTHFPKPHPFGKCVPLCIHPANACECVVQDGLVIGVMENVTPNACHGCAYECQEKSLEDFEAFTICIVLHEGPRTAKLLSQHGLLGGCSHVIQILLGGVILCGNPVVE